MVGEAARGTKEARTKVCVRRRRALTEAAVFKEAAGQVEREARRAAHSMQVR